MKNLKLTLICLGLIFSLISANEIKPKLAVYKVDTKVLPKEDAAELSQFISTEIAKYPDYEVMSWTETGKVLGFMIDQQNFNKALSTEDSTLNSEADFTRLGKTLGVDFMLSSGVSKIGDRYLLNLSLNSIKSAQRVKSVSVKVKGNLGDLLDSIPPLVAEVLNQKYLPNIQNFKQDLPVPSPAPLTQKQSSKILKNWSLGVFLGSSVLAIAANLGGDESYQRYKESRNLAEIQQYRSEMQSAKKVTTFFAITALLSGGLFVYTYAF